MPSFRATLWYWLEYAFSRCEEQSARSACAGEAGMMTASAPAMAAPLMMRRDIDVCPRRASLSLRDFA